jgi:Zn-dependent membrane protease YugP
MYFGPGWWLLVPGMLLMFWAQIQIKSTYGRYSQVASSLGVTGAQAARQILDNNGLRDIAVEAVPGELSDHYDPSAKAVRLSEGNFYSTSVAAVAVAAHECGHALQDAKGYWPMNVRAALVPVANIGSSVGPMLVMAGIFFSSFSFLVNIGILLFAAAFLFHVVTLPVEFDASSRALKLVDGEMLQGEENQGARRVLTAAAWTYVATTLYSLLQLGQLLMLRNNR